MGNVLSHQKRKNWKGGSSYFTPGKGKNVWQQENMGKKTSHGADTPKKKALGKGKESEVLAMKVGREGRKERLRTAPG